MYPPKSDLISLEDALHHWLTTVRPVKTDRTMWISVIGVRWARMSIYALNFISEPPLDV